MSTVALVTCRAALAPGLEEDMPLLVSALESLGVRPTVAVWDDPTVDWAAFDLAVVRSTWDYAPRRAEFLAWAQRVAALTRLHNPPAVLRWSTDKRYLADLAAAGVPTVPTLWLEPGHDPIVDTRGGIVVKPAVGAGAVGAGRFEDTAEGRVAAAEHAGRLLAEGRAVMVQPYLDAIDHIGETAIVFIDGEPSHAVAKEAILRVEGQSLVEGGLYAEERMSPREASAEEHEVAAAALAAAFHRLAVTEPLLYGRVDLVPGEDGTPIVLEVELAEPSLFLAYTDTPAADRLAAAIARRL